MPKMLTAGEKVATIRDLMIRNTTQLQAALPRHLTADRMLRLVMTEIARNPKLLDCTPNSLLGAVLQASQLGLEIGILGMAYLVPFRNNKKGTVEVQFIPGYKGLIGLCRRSNEISTFQAHTVYSKDAFDYAYGSDAKLVHKPCGLADPGDITHFYAAAKLKDGGFQFEVMTKAQVDKHRDRYSRAANDGPWATAYEEMSQKTCLRRLFKLLPSSVEVQTAIALDELAEAQVSQELGVLFELPEEGSQTVEGEGKGAGVSETKSLAALTQGLKQENGKDKGQTPLSSVAPQPTQADPPKAPAPVEPPQTPQAPPPAEAPKPPQRGGAEASAAGLMKEINKFATEAKVPLEDVNTWTHKTWGHKLIECTPLELQAVRGRLSQWGKGEKFV